MANPRSVVVDRLPNGRVLPSSVGLAGDETFDVENLTPTQVALRIRAKDSDEVLADELDAIVNGQGNPDLKTLARALKRLLPAASTTEKVNQIRWVP